CMTRSSTNELFIPFKDPEREFRSSRKHFKTLSLDKLRSPDFNLFSDQEYSEEEELRTNTFSCSDHEDANEHIEKFLEIVDLFYIPNITIDQVMLRAFLMSLTRAEVILFYNGLGIPTRQILDSRGAIPSKTDADAKVAIQEMAEHSQKWHNGTSRSRSTETSDGLESIRAQLNNLGREIKKVNEKVYAAQVGCEQCKGPHYTKDCPLKEEGKTLEQAYYMKFGGPFQRGGYRAATLGFY
ncbi:homeodomain-like protein, partial [Tanacetum coccineum]